MRLILQIKFQFIKKILFKQVQVRFDSNRFYRIYSNRYEKF